MQPDALPPYVNVALAYNALGQNDKAEASLRHALSLDPTNAAANLNLGMLLAEMGKMSEAEQAFRSAFKADPKSAQAAYNLGILLSKDQPEEALTWSRRAAELRPDNPQYGYTYAFYLYRAGQLDQALKTLRQVRQRFPAARRQPAARTSIAARAGHASAATPRRSDRRGARVPREPKLSTDGLSKPAPEGGRSEPLPIFRVLAFVQRTTCSAAAWGPVPSTLWSALQMNLYSRRVAQFFVSQGRTDHHGTTGSMRPVRA